MTKLIFGGGYLGGRVARRWCDAGDEVFVVTRDADRARALAAQGYRPIVADVLRPTSLAALPAAETVLYAIGYDRSAGGSMREVFVTGLKSVLNALPIDTGKLIFVSSTGVYAQTQGEWVDEDSPCEPKREGGRLCLAAEQTLASHSLASRAVVLRMAGLYGPGRIPNAAAIRAGELISAPLEGYLNLIHIDDAASVVLAAEERARLPRVYVVSDGNPVLRRDYYLELARLLKALEPRFVAPSPEVPASLRAESNKRVNNARMRSELAVKLAYPTYREGLAAIVEADKVPDKRR